MFKRLLTVAAIALGSAALLATAPFVLALAGEYGRGDPKQPVGNSEWRGGVSDLANRTCRVGGYWVNSSDTFYYKGDAKALNSFLQDYAKLGENFRPPLILSTDDRLNSLPADDDWEMDAGKGYVSVIVPLDRRVHLADLRVPNNVDVSIAGKPTEQTKKWLEDRAATTQPTTKPSEGKPS